MPTYEYRCKDCGEHLEVQQAFTDDPLTVCPNCSGTLKKKFSSVGISFKGSGFYKTDSRSSTSSTTPASSTSSAGSGSDSSSSGSGSSDGTKSSTSSDGGSTSSAAPAASTSSTSSSSSSSSD